ncbi:MAG TPA: alginate export family protein [Planctomycetota bacterium]|jgi:hypothetical protein|nr:alginate export family protein [Planctomycetota bacterium]
MEKVLRAPVFFFALATAAYARQPPAPESKPAALSEDPLATGLRELTEKLKFSGEVRYRWEGWRFFEDSGAPPTANKRDYSFGAFRTVLGATYAERPFTIYGAAQDVHMWSLPERATGGPGQTYFASSGSTEDPDALTLFHLWVEGKEGDFRLRAGRQGIVEGGTIAYASAPKLARMRSAFLTERLVGTFSWSNGQRTYDGASLALENEAWFAQAYYAGVNAGAFDIDDNTRSLHHFSTLGGDLVAKPGTILEGAELRGFAVYAKDHRGIVDATFGDPIDILTFGASAIAVYPLGSGEVDFLLWIAGQGGDLGALDHRAFAHILEAGCQWKEAPLEPWLRLGWARASGDSDPTDGDSRGFYNVLPTNHKYYGFADILAFSNLSDLYAELFLAMAKSLELRTDYHFFSVVTNDSPAVAGSGAFNDSSLGYTFRPTGGNTDIGRELDLLLTWRATKSFDLALGWSHFAGGGVIRNRFSNEDANFLYGQATLRF